jgi:Zn-dependent protease with chaperone function
MPIEAPVITSRRSLTIWAVVAVVLIVISYLFTLSLVLACIGLPLLWRNLPLGIGNFLLAGSGIAVGGVILWSLIPRTNRFVPPAPSLDAPAHPRLFAELASIAEVLDVRMPDDVYLVLDVNAGVADRGGLLGFGSRRVMHLGLPPMATLTVSQFRAVLAHEFAHYYSGDTRLWPWLHKTREALARTVHNLAPDSMPGILTRNAVTGWAYLLAASLVFAYWSAFFRLSNFVLRKHEYRADELAARIAGPTAFAGALKQISVGRSAFLAYFNTQFLPLLDLGYRPELGDGFARFLRTPIGAMFIGNSMLAERWELKLTQLSTHPPLRHRTDALGHLPEPFRLADDSSAVHLLGSVDSVEAELVKFAVKGTRGPLQAVSWDRIAEDALLPAWRAAARNHRELLAPYTVDRLPEAIAAAAEIGDRIPDAAGRLLTRAQRHHRGLEFVWHALAVVLVLEGWEIRAELSKVHLRKGDNQIDPSAIARRLQFGDLTPSAWRDRCVAAGLTGVPLAPPAAAPEMA